MSNAIVVGVKDDVLEGGRVVVDVEGSRSDLRLDGQLHASENRCVHAGGPYCQGKLTNRVVEQARSRDAHPRRRLRPS